MDTRPVSAHPTAWIVLAGHPDAPAHLSVERYSRVARLYRTALFAILWIGSTVATFFVTIFDPFMTSMPLLVGAMLTYRSWRSRFRVMEFHGACPRCHQSIALKAGSKIGSPHHLVCYHCHHEPDLYLAA
jgi:hypothetical protein